MMIWDYAVRKVALSWGREGRADAERVAAKLGAKRRVQRPQTSPGRPGAPGVRVSAFEVTFRITRPAAWSAEKPGPTYEEYLQGLARIVRDAIVPEVGQALGFNAYWKTVEAAGGDAPRRLKWSDAVEVEG